MGSSVRSKLPLTLVLILSFAAFSLAASSSAFCKCTCFGNSTIIDLNGGGGGSSAKSKKVERTCNDCTKKLCIDYHLPICKGAEEEDVFTQCFWRDSAKDQAVVFIFIIATLGLLVYAAVKPWVDRWRENISERRTYAPISGQGEQ